MSIDEPSRAPPATSEAPQDPTKAARNGRVRPREVWNHPFIIFVIVLFAILVGLTSLIGWSAYRLISENTGAGAALMCIRVLQVTVGLIAGLVLIPVGVVLAWYGITGSIDASAEGSEIKGRLVTSSPGVLLFICGTILMHAAISSKIDVSDSQGKFQGWVLPNPRVALENMPKAPDQAESK
jgi:hypothetical protein